MSEITVIAEAQEAPISQEERDILLQELRKELGLPESVVRDFAANEDALIAQEARRARSDLPLLLLPRLLAYAPVIPLLQAGDKNAHTIEYNFLAAKNAAPVNAPTTTWRRAAGDTERLAGFLLRYDSPLYETTDNAGRRAALLRGTVGSEYLWRELWYAHKQADNYLRCQLDCTPELVWQHADTYSWILFTSEAQAMTVINQLFEIFVQLDAGLDLVFTAEFIASAATTPVRQEGAAEKKAKKKPGKAKPKPGQKSGSKPGSKDGHSRLFTRLQLLFSRSTSEPSPLEVVGKTSLAVTKQVWAVLEPLEALLGIKLARETDDGVWQQLSALGLADLLAHAVFEPTTKTERAAQADSLRTMMDKLRYDATSRAESLLLSAAIDEGLMREMTQRWIYLQRFGQDRFTKAMTLLPRYGRTLQRMTQTEPALLDYVAPAERKVVEREFTRRESITTRDTPWGDLVRQLRHAQLDSDRLHLWAKLRAMLPKRYEKITQDWIRGPDGDIIICPHVAARLAGEAAEMPGPALRERLLEYADEVPLFDAYYCRICGEELTHTGHQEGLVVMEGDGPATMHKSDDELYEMISRQISGIVRGQLKFRELPTARYLNQLVAGMTTTLYSFVALLSRRLQQSRTAGPEETRAKQRLFVQIYCYALTIKMMGEHHAEVKFDYGRKDRGFIRYQSEQVFDQALLLLKASSASLLQELRELDETFLRESLMKAYKNLTGTLGKSQLAKVEPDDLRDAVELDPIFDLLLRYIRWHNKGLQKHTARLTDVWPGKIPAAMYAAVALPAPATRARDAFFALVGISTVGKQGGAPAKKPARTAKRPPVPERKPEPKVPESGNGSASSAARPATIRLLEDGYYEAATRQLLEYLRDKAYVRSYDPVAAVWQTLDAELKRIATAAYLLEEIKQHIAFRPRGATPYTTSLRFIPERHNTARWLSRNYGATVNEKLAKLVKLSAPGFHRHRWSVFVSVPTARYRGPGVYQYKTTELTVGGTLAAGQVVVDQLCRDCYHSATHVYEEIPDAAVLLVDYETVTNFYNYYAYRCPEATDDQPFHEYGKKAKQTGKNSLAEQDTCRHCGYKVTLGDARDAAYYKRYQKQFTQQTKEERNEAPMAEKKTTLRDVEAARAKVATVPAVKSRTMAELVDKSFEWVRRSGHPMKKPAYQSFWEHLGLAEQLEYDSVIAGKARWTADPATQLNKIGLLVAEVVYLYERLRYVERAARDPAPDIAELVDSASGGRAAWSKLPALDQLTKYPYRIGLRAAQAADATPEGQAEYARDYLTNLVLATTDAVTKTLSAKTGEAYFLCLFRTVFELEQTSSKLREAKAASIEALETKKDDSNYTGEEAAPDLDELRSTEGNDFSYEGMDYEGQNEDN